MNVEQKTAEALLNKGIKVRVTAPLLLRLIGIRKIRPVVRSPYLGTLHRISLLFLASGITPDQLESVDEASAHDLYTKYTGMLTQVMAQAILNGQWRGKVFGKLLAKYLVWHCDAIEMMTIAHIMVSLNSKTAFTNTIRSVSSMTTTRPNLSQATQGS